MLRHTSVKEDGFASNFGQQKPSKAVVFLSVDIDQNLPVDFRGPMWSNRSAEVRRFEQRVKTMGRYSEVDEPGVAGEHRWKSK